MIAAMLKLQLYYVVLLALAFLQFPMESKITFSLKVSIFLMKGK
jgi:hypothetical protein